MSRTQVLALRKDEPIVIETPEGMITIIRHKDKHGSFQSNKAQIEMPSTMMAYVGKQRALDNARFIEVDEDGTVTAKYNILMPKVDKQSGSLIGVQTQEVIRV
jgi:hypothetical protein